ncbi:MAG TPA: ATP synthase F1 subunit epsilon [Acidimicrobiales bacterium]|nr:ATP synthase F1 subunit epsilon [Acidimicrobiales bacterium]
MTATQVELVTPERTLYSGEAEMVVTRTVGGGNIAFLANHMPFVGAIEPGLVRVVLEGGDEVRVAVHGGFVEVRDNRVIMVADVAELAEDIDVERARRAQEEAQRGAGEDPEAEAALRRAEVRLEVSGRA